MVLREWSVVLKAQTYVCIREEERKYDIQRSLVLYVRKSPLPSAKEYSVSLGRAFVIGAVECHPRHELGLLKLGKDLITIV